jgi:conjugal transfer pilus assembly protein TraV
MKFFYLPFMAAGILLLSGCAGTQSDFTCHATSSDTCMTMEEANQRARQKTKESSVKRDAVSLPAPVNPVISTVNTVPMSSDVSMTSKTTLLPSVFNDPVRLSEMTAQIWIAPWVDDKDNYHAQSRIAFVVKPGEWR